jgi:predicted LPLAT superfamily acyltransferase
MSVKWEGKSKGALFGHKIFVFILNHLGLKLAYIVLRFVALYYFLFARKSNKNIFYFFHEVLKYKRTTSWLKIYKNYYIFGQTILDKVALLAGVKTKFTINHDGGKNLDKIAEMGRGGILVSAHIGNWDIAGQLLNRLDTTFNILMYENERSNLKEYMEGIETKKNIKIIAIKDGEMGHLIELHNAFANNELVVMHGDRFRENAKTVEAKFLGKTALFPIGPFIMAAKFGVPLSVVFAVKETNTHYHFFATDPIEVKRTRTEVQTNAAVKELLGKYIDEFEKMVHRYPEQWFNYYAFWKEQG